MPLVEPNTGVEVRFTQPLSGREVLELIEIVTQYLGTTFVKAAHPDHPDRLLTGQATAHSRDCIRVIDPQHRNTDIGLDPDAHYTSVLALSHAWERRAVQIDSPEKRRAQLQTFKNALEEVALGAGAH